MYWRVTKWAMAGLALAAVSGCSQTQAEPESGPQAKQADVSLDTLMADANKAGAIMTVEDLNRMYGAKDSENAAPIIRAAMNLKSSRPAGSSQDVQKALDAIGAEVSPFYHKRKPTMDVATAIKVLKMELDHYRIVEQVIDKQKCDFKPDWRAKHDPLSDDFFPEQAMMKYQNKINARYATAMAVSGKIDEAIERFQLAFHLGTLVGDNPNHMGHIIHTACDAVAIREVEVTLAKLGTSKDGEEFRAKITPLIKALPAENVTRYLHGDIVLSGILLETIKDLIKNPPKRPAGAEEEAEPDPMELASKQPGSIEAWTKRSLAWRIRLKELADGSQGDPVKALSLLRSLPPIEPSDELSKMIDVGAMNYELFLQGGMKVVARRETLLAGIDVLNFKQQSGQWPETLPVARRDPFGDTLKYRIEGENVRIWSIGADGKDSNGHVKREETDSDDISARM